MLSAPRPPTRRWSPPRRADVGVGALPQIKSKLPLVDEKGRPIVDDQGNPILYPVDSPTGVIDPPWGTQTNWGTFPNDCKKGSQPENGACKPQWVCPTGFRRNTTTGYCDPESPGYCDLIGVYDEQTAECVPKKCPPDFVWNREVQACQYRLTGKPCCKGRPLTEACLDPEHMWSAEGECVDRPLPHCQELYGPNALYDPKTGRCGCEEGYERSDLSRACLPIPSPVRPSSSFVPALLSVGVGAGLGLAASIWWGNRS